MEELFFGFRRKRVATLVVDAHNLLVTSDDASLDGGFALRVGKHTGVIDTRFSEAAAEIGAAFVVDDSFGADFLASENTEGLNGRAEGREIRSDVAGSAKTIGLRDKIDDGNRGFGGEASGTAKEVAIEHEIAEEGDAYLTEAGEKALESGDIGGVGIHRKVGRLLGGDFGFFEEHDGDVVANGIDTPADVAFEAGAVGKQMDRLLADDTDENLEQLLGNRH